MRSRWIPSRRNRKKLQKRNGCNKCRKNKECNKKVCVNDNGHAKSFNNTCEANKYLMKQPKSLELVSFALGDCKELYSQCLYTEWFNLDDPTDKGDHEGVAQIFSYLSDLSNKHVHRSCSMNNIHYPVEIQTTQDQQDGKGGIYLKKPYEITCHNNPSLHSPYASLPELQSPYIWDAANTTCRDRKLRYCCENMWGEPALYKVVSQKVKEDKMMKVIPSAISKQSDMFVDPPTKKTLFEDCDWRSFISFKPNGGSDIDPIYSHTAIDENIHDICGRRNKIPQKGNALYIDARTIDKGQKPWDETGDLLNKVSPTYGVYCEEKNNGKACQDYKYRLCCKKKVKDKHYGKWGKFGKCMGDCGPEKGHKTRTRDCIKLSDGSYRPNCINIGLDTVNVKYVVVETKDCTKTDAECQDTIEWTEWEMWKPCSVTCGEGERIRHRFCIRGAQNACLKDGRNTEVGKCRSAHCHDYTFGEWKPWGKCMAAKCGTGTQIRSRICFDKAYDNEVVDNSFCSSSLDAALIVQDCIDKDQPLCKRDGGWSEWQPWPIPDPYRKDEWGKCDAICGTGMTQSKRFCDNPSPASGGADCKGEDLKNSICLATNNNRDYVPCPPNFFPEPKVTLGKN